MKHIRTNILLVVWVGMSFSLGAKAQVIHSDTIKKTTIAYDTQPEWQVTGSVSSVKGEVLTKTFTSNVATSLYGRIPGLFTQQGGGEPGYDTPTLRSRGVSTFGNGRDIFFVIDNIPSTIDVFQQLSPYEIESVTLLKDASATAIYGSRAANGVMLINTKRGKIAPLSVNFNIQYGIQQPTRLPDFLGAQDYARLYNEALVNDKGPGSEIYTEADIAAYRNGTDPVFHPNVNWYDQLLRKQTPIANYNLNAQGGTGIVQYFVMLNVIDNHGLYKDTEKISENTQNQSFTRYNFRTNIDIALSRYLKGVVTLGGAIEDKTNPGVDDKTNNVFNLMASIPPNAFPVYVSPDMYGGNSSFTNPWGDITQRGYTSYNSRNTQTTVKLIGNLGMITQGLSISGAISFNTHFRNFSSKTRTYRRYTAEKDAAENINYKKFGDNTSMEGNESRTYQWRNMVFQGFLNYDRTFGNHSVNAMLMTGYDEYAERNNYNDQARNHVLPYINVNSGGRFNYSFDQRYIASFSFGYMGSDNFAPGHRFGFFPAGSVGWIVSNEEFMRDNKIVDYLKLKASYGLTGNNDIGGSNRFMYNQYYTANEVGYYFGTPQSARDGLVQGILANPLVTWEKEKHLNIGAEFSLFKHFDFNFEYFRRNRYDILAKPNGSVPDFLGTTTLPDMNVGEVENNGFEASIKYHNELSKELSYFVEGGVWFARNKIIYNSEAPMPYNYLYKTGQRIDQPFLLEYLGFFSGQEDINNSPKQMFADEVKPGDVKYKNQNSTDDNVIDKNDLYPIGYSPLPELNFSLHGGVKYKNFDLEFLFQGAGNRSVYWEGKYIQAFQNDGKISSIALDRWTPETAATATYPRLSSSNNLNNFQQSSLWQKNGSFLKLRNLEIGYTVPKNLSQKITLENIRVFFNGTNLFSFDHMEGLMDPEATQNGLGYPVMRTFSLGLSIQL